MEEKKNPQKMTWMLCQRAWCSQGSSGRAGGVVNPVTKARATSWGAGRNTGLETLPTARRACRAASSPFSAANAGRSRSSPGVSQVLSPGSITRTIGCQITGTYETAHQSTSGIRNDAAQNPALARGDRPARGLVQVPFMAGAWVWCEPYWTAAYLAAAASLGAPIASLESEPSMYRVDRLRLRVDLVGDVEGVGDLAAAVQRVERVLLLEARQGLLRREEARARHVLRVLLGRHAGAASHHLDGLGLIGRVTHVGHDPVPHLHEADPVVPSLRQALWAHADEVVNEARHIGAGEDRLRTRHRLERLTGVRLPGADGVHGPGGQRLRRLGAWGRSPA